MKLFNKNKKGQIFSALSGLAIGVVTLAVIMVVCFLILSQTKANTLVSADANSTGTITSLTQSLGGVSPWVPIIIICMIGGILIALVRGFGQSAQ